MNLQDIIIPIQPTLGGIPRQVQWEGFSFWYHTKKEAEMLCSVWLLDNEGNRIQNADIAQGRTVRIEISNRNRVTPEGILIEPDTTEWEQGIPEYDFYFGAFMLNPEGTAKDVITQALQALTLYNRWDRI